MNPFARILAAAAFLLAASLPAADPFSFTAPRDWRPERIPFPLGFAPELKYTGFEELCFGPGMFKPGTDTYWTYTYFWWLDGEQKITQATLEKDLVAYYRGLSQAVGRSRKFKIDPEKITAKLRSTTESRPPDGPYPPAFTGTLQTYDAFVTGELIRLHIEVSFHRFESADHTWIFFSLSPHAPADKNIPPVWPQMHRIRDSFKLR